MKNLTPFQAQYLELAQVFHLAEREHFVLFFTGECGRHKKTERILPALVRKGVLIRHRHGKRYLYAIPARAKELQGKVEHGLVATEGLIRFARADKENELIPEGFFKASGFGVVPEWGIRYRRGSLLLFEYSGKAQAYSPAVIVAKIGRYEKALQSIEGVFGTKPLVLFVLDVSRKNLENLVGSWQPLEDMFFFCDLETFNKVPLGEQLTAPVYIWGKEGGSYPLRHA